MKKKSRLYTNIILTVIAVFLCLILAGRPLPRKKGLVKKEYRVENVIDGDSFNLIGGEKVRLLGIDAPEAGEPGADIAKDFLQMLILNKKIRLEKDVTDKDKYGRLLRYVYCNKLFVNKEMIRKGYVVVCFYPPDERHKEEFIKAQGEAEKFKRGLWATGVFQPTNLSLPGSAEQTGVAEEEVGKGKTPKVSSREDVISWKDADKYYGKIKTVEGTIVATYNSGKACFLNFHPDYKAHFTAVILAGDFDKFSSPPEDYYLHKKVRIKGLIKRYQGSPEIVISNPSQIEVVK